MAERNPALSVTQVFAYRLRDARLTKRWTQDELAARMDKIGSPIQRATIAKIESAARGVGGAHGDEPPASAQRRVTIDEAVAFAVALDVPVTSLLLPIIEDDDVQLAPNVRVSVDVAHAWARGDRPLDPDDERYYRFQSFVPQLGWSQLARMSDEELAEYGITRKTRQEDQS